MGLSGNSSMRITNTIGMSVSWDRIGSTVASISVCLDDPKEDVVCVKTSHAVGYAQGDNICSSTPECTTRTGG